MYYTYILLSQKDGALYKGSTADVEKRLLAHNSGKVFATKSRRPFRLLYTEEFASRVEAIDREKYFKTFKGGKELAKILAEK
jgi:putative endonuclease